MNKNKVIGWFSLLSGILTIIGFLLKLELNFITLYLGTATWFYTFYKTVIRHKNLTKEEWSVIAFMILIGYVLPFITYFNNYFNAPEGI